MSTWMNSILPTFACKLEIFSDSMFIYRTKSYCQYIRSIMWSSNGNETSFKVQNPTKLMTEWESFRQKLVHAILRMKCSWNFSKLILRLFVNMNTWPTIYLVNAVVWYFHAMSIKYSSVHSWWNWMLFKSFERVDSLWEANDRFEACCGCLKTCSNIEYSWKNPEGSKKILDDVQSTKKW